MKKNILAVCFAGCGLLCAQKAALSADKVQLPSTVAFSSKLPLKLSIRAETSNPDAVYSCNKIIKFFIYDYKPFANSDRNGPPWIVEVSKTYDPPFTDADKMVRTLRESPCNTSGKMSWTISQETTFHENVKPGSAKPKK